HWCAHDWYRQEGFDMKPLQLLAIVGAGLIICLEAARPAAYLEHRTLLAVGLILLAVLHGSLDQVLARYSLRRSGLSFIGCYLAAMALMGFLFWLIPTVALILFLLLSAYHFGEAEFDEDKTHKAMDLLQVVARGGLFGIAPLLLHPTAVAGVLVAMGVTPRLPSAELGWTLFLGLFSLNFALLLKEHPNSRLASIAQLCTLTLLFLVADPFIAFSVFFGLFHALTHLSQVALRVSRKSGWRQLAKRALPIIIPTLIGVVGFGLWVNHVGVSDQVLAYLFIGLATLTLPHTFLVWRFNERSRSPSF
ncbi:MAG: Brp/Blh family beta-carotene 15,15'-dioxygenase, partial [Polyangiaceae bacterium]|nr:Brp/Blh family beta-carotene 15,15'-dioxygenase [Polyangiaceae bacterium]